jgi:hypothetical protein
MNLEFPEKRNETNAERGSNNQLKPQEMRVRFRSCCGSFGCLCIMHYNFTRIHRTLKITPAMAANATAKLWEMSDMVKVPEDWKIANAA